MKLSAADEMQHFDHRTIGRHRGKCRERDRHGRDKDQQQQADAARQNRAGHGAHALDKAAMS